VALIPTWYTLRCTLPAKRIAMLTVMPMTICFIVLDDFGDGSAFTKDHQQFCFARLRPSMDAPLRYAFAIDRPKQAASVQSGKGQLKQGFASTERAAKPIQSGLAVLGEAPIPFY
jgi:hypothetical protein